MMYGLFNNKTNTVLKLECTAIELFHDYADPKFVVQHQLVDEGDIIWMVDSWAAAEHIRTSPGNWYEAVETYRPYHTYSAKDLSVVRLDIGIFTSEYST